MSFLGGGAGGKQQQGNFGQNNKEMEQLFENAQQKEFVRLYNSLVEKCFFSCVNDFSGKSLTSKEEMCMYRCTDKFMRHTTKVAQVFTEITMAEQAKQEGN